jgi:hypothetical protein
MAAHTCGSFNMQRMLMQLFSYPFLDCCLSSSIQNETQVKQRESAH